MDWFEMRRAFRDEEVGVFRTGDRVHSAAGRWKRAQACIIAGLDASREFRVVVLAPFEVAQVAAEGGGGVCAPSKKAIAGRSIIQ